MWVTLTDVIDSTSSEMKQKIKGSLVHIMTVSASPVKKPVFMLDIQDFPIAFQRLTQHIMSAGVHGYNDVVITYTLT